eukprot:13247025-Alexandrium_andersonii.AAC.1
MFISRLGTHEQKTASATGVPQCMPWVRLARLNSCLCSLLDAPRYKKQACVSAEQRELTTSAVQQ